jgi:cobalamin biosynthesis protein CobT
LNIPFIADHVTPAYDPKELASQIVNMIFLRPEIDLCYLGISHKCFEILENRPLDDQNSTTEVVTTQGELDNHLIDDDDDDDGDDTDEDDEDNDDDEDDEDDETATEAVEADGIEYEASETNDESDNGSELGSETDSGKLSLRLREILFYDDKVAIFKARHMRL